MLGSSQAAQLNVLCCDSTVDEDVKLCSKDMPQKNWFHLASFSLHLDNKAILKHSSDIWKLRERLCLGKRSHCNGTKADKSLKCHQHMYTDRTTVHLFALLHTPASMLLSLQLDPCALTKYHYTVPEHCHLGCHSPPYSFSTGSLPEPEPSLLMG